MDGNRHPLPEQLINPSRKPDKLLLFTYINLGLLLALLAVEFVIGERRWWSTFITYMPQQPLLIPTVLLLAIAMIKKRWLAAWWNLPALLIGIFALLGFNIPLHRSASSGDTLRVMTWNIHHASGGLSGITSTIISENPDIVCLQEAEELPPAFPQSFPGWSMMKNGETAILSRYPMIRQTAHPVAGRVMNEAVIEARGRKLTVIAVHFNTSFVSDSLSNTRGGFAAYLRKTAEIRARQTEELLSIASRANSPVIIAGDFNTPPRGIIFRRIAREYPNAFAAAGFGTGYTYPTRFSAMRIDHIFTSKDIAVRRCRPVRSKLSDHLPVVAELSVH